MRVLKASLAAIAFAACDGMAVMIAWLNLRFLLRDAPLLFRIAYAVMLGIVVYVLVTGRRWSIRVGFMAGLLACCCALEYGRFGLSMVGLSSLVLATCSVVLLLCLAWQSLRYLAAYYRDVFVRYGLLRRSDHLHRN
jgi:hypothetical protein